MAHITLGEDDRLHPASDDDSWFEAFWFGFYVPERALSVYAYPWFRTKLALYGGGVLAWDAAGSEPWSMLHNDYAWSKRFDGEADMIDGAAIATPQGVTIECLETGRSYRVAYAHPALSFDVRFDAVDAANVNRKASGSSALYAGHIDQPGHYTGWVEVAGARHEVDCHGVRDRSWGPRRDDNFAMHIGYYHATASARDAFLIITDAGDSADASTLLSGYLIRDGERAPLERGSATITRNEKGAPMTCTIEASDTLGRTLTAQGEGINRAAFQLQPGMFNWSSLARWRFGEVEAYGELQDTWHPDKYRRFIREKAAS